MLTGRSAYRNGGPQVRKEFFLTQLLDESVLRDIDNMRGYLLSNPVQFLRNDVASYTTYLHGKGADHGTIQVHNLLLVLNHIREHGPISRGAIAEKIGLSRVTVGTIVDELEKRGIVHEGNKLNAATQGGRRATTICFNADAGYIIGVDIDRSRLTLLLTNLAGEPVDEWSATFKISDGVEKSLKFVAEQLEALLERNSVTWEQVVGIGLATPGPLNPQLRKVLSSSQVELSSTQMPGWEDKDILDRLIHELKKTIPIYLDKDANMGALGEYRYGVGRGIANLAYVKISIGIGAGLIIDGHLYHGTSGAAGEFGHIVAKEESKDKCACGKYGCLETIVAVPAIAKAACKDDISQVLYEAQNGNEACAAALKHAGKQLGIALGTLINLLNPEMIVLDGTMLRKNELFFQSVYEYAQKTSLHATWHPTRIVYSQLDGKSIALGAVANVIDHVFRMPYTGNNV